MLTAIKDMEISCSEQMLNIAPLAITEASTSMEDVKASEESTESPEKEKKMMTSCLTLVAKSGAELKLTNTHYCAESFFQSL